MEGLNEHHYYHNHTETKLVPYEKTVNITNKKAPTDESVRLLREMEETARRNIIYNAAIDSNGIKAYAVYFQANVSSDLIYHVKFVINGIEHLIEGRIDRFEWKTALRNKFGGFGVEQIFRAFHKKLSGLIAAELMKKDNDFLKVLQTQI